MKKYIITIIIILAIIVIAFTAYFIYKNVGDKTDAKTVEAKANQEIKYLDTTIISMLNNFNHISYANYKTVEDEITISSQENQESSGDSQSSGGSGEDSQKSSGGEEQSSQNQVISNTNVVESGVLTNTNKQVDWDSMKQQTELMYATWPNILIDLSSLNVNKDNLLKYTTTLDEIVKALEKKDKKVAVTKIAELYGLTTTYLDEYSNNQTLVSVFKTKSQIAYAYALAEYDNKWEQMKEHITKAKNEYASIVNNPLNHSNNINSINKGYILLNEIEKNLEQKDKNIFYINYKNLMQELEIIEG